MNNTIGDIIQNRTSCDYDNDDNICLANFYQTLTTLSIDELRKYIVMIPKGTIIYHGSTAIKYSDDRYPNRNVPPLYPVVDKKINYTAIKKLMNEATKIKALGTISHSNLQDIDKQEKKKKYLEDYKNAEKEGISMSLNFMWCNLSIDTNVMVDKRVMESMTVFLTNKDLFFINYIKLSKDMLEQNLPYQYFKRSFNIPKEYTMKDDELNKRRINEDPPFDESYDYYVDMTYSNVYHGNISINIRNKYSNMIGDSLFLSILSYILSFKGFEHKINGYIDVDSADGTYNLLDPMSKKICGTSNNVLFVCKEIMLMHQTKHLAYLGSYNIENFQDQVYDVANNKWKDISLIKYVLDDKKKKLLTLWIIN